MKVYDRKTDFSSIEADLREVNSKPTPVPIRELHVHIVESEAMRSFNEAFVREGYRKNPLLAAEMNLTEEELYDYEVFLIHKRVEIVQGRCKDFRLIRRFAMPCFIERVLTDIGKVRIPERGLIIYPKVDESIETIPVLEAQKISDRILAFYDDLSIVVGAMPGTEAGNPETMTMALIEDYVRGMGDYNDPVLEYIVYFLKLQLEEKQFNCLYYMEYDDAKTIAVNMATLGTRLVV